MAEYVYDSSGLPFDKKLGENVRTLLKRIDEKKASLIIIDGGVGSGKTTLAVHLVNYVNSLRDKSKISLEIKNHPQLSLGGEEFAGCFRVCHNEKLPVIIYDEAGDFSRRGAITKFNMMINRFFETYRGFKILVIICLPNFNVLDNQIFDNQIPRMLIHIEKRNMNQGSYKVYSLSQMNWIRYWFDKLPKGAKHKAYGNVQPNAYGQFKNLSPDMEKALDKLSTYGKKQLLKTSEIKMKGLYSYTDLMKLTNRSQYWISKTLKNAKIKPRTIDKKRYYDKYALDLLYQEIEDAKQRMIEGARRGKRR